jgi:hypothetical protein
VADGAVFDGALSAGSWPGSWVNAKVAPYLVLRPHLRGMEIRSVEPRDSGWEATLHAASTSSLALLFPPPPSLIIRCY